MAPRRQPSVVGLTAWKPYIGTLGFIVLTMGPAFLLGHGFAVAVTIQLDGTAADNNAPEPLVYAIETLSANFFVGNNQFFTLVSPSDDVTVAVAAKRQILPRERLYVRLWLGGGLVFDEDTDSSLSSAAGGANVPFADRHFGGERGGSVIVFRLNHTRAIGVGETIGINVGNDLAVIASPGDYSAAISVHADVFDAIEGLNARPTFAGRAVITRLATGLDVNIGQGAHAIADLSSDYLSFVGPSAQAKLGYVRVGANRTLRASDGGLVEAHRDLVAEGGVSIEVEGDLSIGAFHFVKDELRAFGSRIAECPGASASAEDPDRGTLVDAEGVKLIGPAGNVADVTSGLGGPLNAGTYSLCVNVDVLGPESNANPIPAREYIGRVSIRSPNSPIRADPVIRGLGPVGKIVRNGTSVHLPYLTVSKLYNQRLVIVNRGSKPAVYGLGSIQTEAGTTADLSAAAKAAQEDGLNVVPPGERLVLRVSELLAVEGDRSRASATLHVNAEPSVIQVATTLINLFDRSTDTIVYPSIPGLGL